MPNIFKRAGSPYWYGRFQHRGKDYVFSTEATDRKTATEALAAKRTEITGDNLTPMIDRIVLSLIGLIEKVPIENRNQTRLDISKRVMLGHTCTLKIADAWQAWQEIPKKTSEATIRGYDAAWRRFAAWAAGLKIEYLHEVSEAAAQDYAADLWKWKVTPSTFNQHKRFLAGLFKKLKAKAGLLVNPWDSVTSLEKEQESRRNLSKAELQKVIGAASGNLRSMLTIGLFTGLRLADVVNLHRDSVKLATGILEVMPIKTRRKKKRVRIPIHGMLRPVLAGLMKTAEDGYLFPEEQRRHSANSSNITAEIQAHFEKCGIQTTEEVADGDHRRRAVVRVGFHSLRHSFVSLCAAGGIPQHVIQGLVGHGSPAMTDIYTHVDEAQTVKAVASLPSSIIREPKRKEAKVTEQQQGSQR